MDFIVKKTTSLTVGEKQSLVAGFNDIFQKQRTVTEFDNQFLNNPLGYSYHALMLESDQIVGSLTYIPCYYMIHGQKHLFANSVDTNISKPYRDFFNLYDLVKTMYAYIQAEGVEFVYGFPNDNAYPVFHKSKLMFDIGRLHVYCLPLHIGGVKSQLKVLNSISSLLCQFWSTALGLFASKRIAHFSIEKEAVSYNRSRYKRGDANYHIITKKGVWVVYKLLVYEGVRCAFLIDVAPKSAYNFNQAVRHIVHEHTREFDLLLYVGSLPFHGTGMIRLPRKLEPKNFNFTGIVLGKKRLEKELMFQLKNWDVNLSNYDLL